MKIRIIADFLYKDYGSHMIPVGEELESFFLNGIMYVEYEDRDYGLLKDEYEIVEEQ